MYSHEKPDGLPVTLGMAQKSGSTLRARPPFRTSRTAWIRGRKASLNTLMTKSAVHRWVFLFPRFSDTLALPSVLLAKRTHCSRSIPSQNNNCPDFLPGPLDRFHHHLFVSITFLISTDPFPPDFALHVEVSLQNLRHSDPMAPSSIPGGIEPFGLLNEGFYCDFTLLPCSTACTNTTHSLGHKQR